MKSIEMNIGGPVMPRSKSRAIVRSLASLGFSRWPMPGGRTQAAVSRSYSHAAVRLPRLAPMAWCIGERTCSSTNTTPTSPSGAASASPRCTAPTRPPMAMAKSAGSSPRSTRRVHQATASARSAWSSTPANFHSLRARRRSITGSRSPRLPMWCPAGFDQDGNGHEAKIMAPDCGPASLASPTASSPGRVLIRCRGDRHSAGDLTLYSTRRLPLLVLVLRPHAGVCLHLTPPPGRHDPALQRRVRENDRSEEHTSELQSLAYLVCRLLLEKKKKTQQNVTQVRHIQML